MDDYSIASLNESKNEWCIRLVNILTYHIIDGFKSIFSEAWKICKDDDELEKYLMTFQNLLSKIPVVVLECVCGSTFGETRNKIDCVRLASPQSLSS